MEEVSAYFSSWFPISIIGWELPFLHVRDHEVTHLPEGHLLVFHLQLLHQFRNTSFGECVHQQAIAGRLARQVFVPVISLSWFWSIAPMFSTRLAGRVLTIFSKCARLDCAVHGWNLQ